MQPCGSHIAAFSHSSATHQCRKKGKHFIVHLHLYSFYSRHFPCPSLLPPPLYLLYRCSTAAVTVLSCHDHSVCHSHDHSICRICWLVFFNCLHENVKEKEEKELLFYAKPATKAIASSTLNRWHIQRKKKNMPQARTEPRTASRGKGDENANR